MAIANMRLEILISISCRGLPDLRRPDLKRLLRISPKRYYYSTIRRLHPLKPSAEIYGIVVAALSAWPTVSAAPIVVPSGLAMLRQYRSGFSWRLGGVFQVGQLEAKQGKATCLLGERARADNCIMRRRQLPGKILTNK